jgi:hypothetical protein
MFNVASFPTAPAPQLYTGTLPINWLKDRSSVTSRDVVRALQLRGKLPAKRLLLSERAVRDVMKAQEVGKEPLSLFLA